MTDSLEVLPLDLDRDYPEIDHLFEVEEWPFIRADLEASHAQPQATAFVARRGEELVGFFIAHHFGEIGYLDMMIVSSTARKTRTGLALYMKLMRGLKQKGIRSFVAHSTNDSYRVFKMLRFQAGQSFTLLARDPQEGSVRGNALADSALQSNDLEALLALDEQVFGMSRPDWIGTLLGQPTTEFHGRRRDGDLVSSVCLRTRKQGAICLDTVNACEFSELQPLLEDVSGGLMDRRVECFARTDSPLHGFLLDRGFAVPEFFEAIGPLVEWRRGPVGPIGDSPRVQSLAWF